MSLRDVSGYPFALGVCVLLLAALVWLLRSQRLREKYAVIWFAVVVGLVVLGFVPQITTWLTRLTGVTTPINLVFILASLVLLVVCIQLSLEISRLEETTRTVSEEVALLRLDMEQGLGHARRPAATPDVPDPANPDPDPPPTPPAKESPPPRARG